MQNFKQTILQGKRAKLEREGKDVDEENLQEEVTSPCRLFYFLFRNFGCEEKETFRTVSGESDSRAKNTRPARETFCDSNSHR